MIAAVGAVLVHVLLSPPPAERVAQAVREVYADDGVQRDLPGEKSAQSRPWEEPESKRERASGDGSERPSTSRIDAPSGVGTGASVLLWALVAAGAAIVLASVARAIADRRRGAGKAAAAAVVASPQAPGAPSPLEAAERLAAEGRFDEAVHLLLLRAVHAIGREGRDGRGVPQAWTSRELLGSAAVAPARRDALSVLVEGVERSLFGGRALGASDWATARAAYGCFEAPAAVEGAAP